LLLGLATLGGTLGGLAAACDDGFNFCDEDDAGYTIAGIFALGYVVNWVWGIVTAVNDVGSYNSWLRSQAQPIKPPTAEPAPVPEPAPAPAEPTELGRDASGTWVGSISPFNSMPYSVKMSVSAADRVGDPAGVILYSQPASACGYFLTLDAVGEETFTFRQNTDESGCDAFGKVSFTWEGEDILTGRWYRPDGTFWVVGVIRRMR
jgi:hypothetical protein